MKLRSYNLIIGIFAMSISNIVYFIWMPYPKSFLKTVGSTTFVFDLFTNLLYFTIFSLMSIVAINAITNTGRRLHTKKTFITIGSCIAVQLGCDITRYVVGHFMRQFSLISDDFFTIVSILLLFLVVVKLLGVKTIHYKKLFAIFVPIMITALIVCIVFDIFYIHSVSDVAEKYFSTPTSILPALSLLDSSSVASTISKNMQYMYEIRNAILDFAAEATILLAVCFSTPTSKAANCESYHTHKAHFVSRIVTLYYGDKKMLDIYMDYEFEGNPIEVLTVNELTVRIICKNQAIAYLKDENPYVITFHDIEDAEFDEILLGTCKKLLEKGRVDCFEYISEYIQKYDPVFIEQYLERYSTGNFTETEFQQMGDINPDYITRCAKQFANQ